MIDRKWVMNTKIHIELKTPSIANLGRMSNIQTFSPKEEQTLRELVEPRVLQLRFLILMIHIKPWEGDYKEGGSSAEGFHGNFQEG